MLDEQVFNLLAELPPPKRYSFSDFVNDCVKDVLTDSEKLEEIIREIKENMPVKDR